MKGRRAKGDGWVKMKAGAMATWRDIAITDESKFENGRNGARDTGPTPPRRRIRAVCIVCIERKNVRLQLRRVESSPRLQDISESKLLMKREGGREREKQREKRGSCYSKSLGPADLENSSRSYYDKIFTERNRGEREGERGENFQVCSVGISERNTRKRGGKWRARKAVVGGEEEEEHGEGNGERRCTESCPLPPLPSILWLNYSGRKIIQSPLLYRLSLEFYPEICSVEIFPGNGEFFLSLDKFEYLR